MPVAARSSNFRLAIRVARMFDRRFVSLNKDVVEPLLQGTSSFWRTTDASETVSVGQLRRGERKWLLGR